MSRKLILLSAAIVVANLASCTTLKNSPTSSLPETLTGHWEWRTDESNCANNPLHLSFENSQQEMLLTYPNPIKGFDEKPLRKARYKVISIGTNRVTVKLEGETRVDSEGSAVTWDLVLLNRNEYCWYRHDWPVEHCTKSIYRCSAGN